MPPNDALHPLRRLWRWTRRKIWRAGDGTVARDVPRARTHVVLLDGTMSSLVSGRETSVGLIWRMLDAQASHDLYYEPGIEWRGWRHVTEVMAGVGVNAQIQRAYLFLAERYRPGDPVFLIGYSRGAYAVRALAGMIDRVGLLRPEHAGEAEMLRAYEHYRVDPLSREARAFHRAFCHADARIAAIGVFDTVQAVGIRWPLLWHLFPKVHAFRSQRLGASVERGFHAMALDETRRAYALDRWRTHGARTLTVEQVWFRGSHGDVGGHLNGAVRSRSLANVSLVWMLDRLAETGLALPDGWRDRFATDPAAPSVGNWRGFGWLFWTRGRRVVGLDASESVHPSAAGLRGTEALAVWDGGPDGSARDASDDSVLPRQRAAVAE